MLLVPLLRLDVREDVALAGRNAKTFRLAVGPDAVRSRVARDARTCLPRRDATLNFGGPPVQVTFSISSRDGSGLWRVCVPPAVLRGAGTHVLGSEDVREYPYPSQRRLP